MTENTDMTEKTDPKQPSGTKVIYRFLGGALLGAFVVMIPISAGAPMDLNLTQISIASLLTLSCGGLSVLWGEKFINAVTQALDALRF